MSGFNQAITAIVIRNAVLVMGVALLSGFALGWALVPESSPFSIGGTSRGWSAAHVGGLLNGLLAMVLAMVLDRLSLSDGLRRWSGWSLVFAIWANTIFYWAGNFSANRGLTLTGNSLGEGSLLGVIAFAPAAVASVVIFIALYAVWVGTKQTKT